MTRSIQISLRTGVDGKTKGVPLNTAYVLNDGSLNNPFSGNMVWALKSFQMLGPAESLAVDSGSIVWHSVQKRALAGKSVRSHPSPVTRW